MKDAAIRQALLLLSLAFLPGIGQAIYFRDKVSWEAPVPASQMVSVAKAKSWGPDVLWVDARPDEDFTRDHVTGAVLLNEDRWDELLPGFSEAWTPGKKVVVYCSNESCNRAMEVARRLRQTTQPPMPDVYVLEGGWEEWLKTRK